MVDRVGGQRRKTRHKFQRSVRSKGKLSLRRFFQKFEAGDQVLLAADSIYQRGMYHGRYHSKVGKVAGMQGSCYKVAIKDGKVEKVLVVHPVHLKRTQSVNA